MDVKVTSCRKTPFIDGKCYPKMCFTCWWVPIEEIQTYGPDGSIIDTKGPFFDHKHLMKAEDMVDQQICDKLRVAKISVKAVKALYKGMTEELNLKRPAQEIDCID